MLETKKYFKNLKIKHSNVINTVAASTFGVLLIHSNSDAMWQWLRKDTCLKSDYAYLHVLLIPAVYIVCTVIDYLRIKLIEAPLLDYVMSLLERSKVVRLLTD